MTNKQLSYNFEFNKQKILTKVLCFDTYDRQAKAE